MIGSIVLALYVKKQNKTIPTILTVDCQQSPDIDLHVYNKKNKNGNVYTILAEGEKQVCDNMNKIWELLMISILMTNHHANQFVLWPQIADWCREM